jgi:hypothetical protein
MGENGRAVPLHMLIEPDAGLALATIDANVALRASDYTRVREVRIGVKAGPAPLSAAPVASSCDPAIGGRFFLSQSLSSMQNRVFHVAITFQACIIANQQRFRIVAMLPEASLVPRLCPLPLQSSKRIGPSVPVPHDVLSQVSRL